MAAVDCACTIDGEGPQQMAPPVKNFLLRHCDG